MKTKPRDVLYCGVDRSKVLRATPSINPVNAAHLLDFITERYKVHYKKDVKGLPAPWTKNQVLRHYKFTNVRREHDRVTKALIEQVSTNPALTMEEKILNTFLFRSWNNPATFADLGGPWKAKAIYSHKLKDRVRPLFKRLEDADPGRKWWSSAYNQGGTKYAWKFPDGEGFGRAPKEEDGKKFPDYEPDIPLRVFHVGPWLKQNNTVERLLNAEDQMEAYHIIKELRGFADFLAYQVFVDLTYIEAFPFSENEFTIAGPGCRKGLDLLFDSYDGMTHEEALFWLRDHIDDSFEELIQVYHPEKVWEPMKLFRDIPEHDRYMNVMSLENCFCELSKYIRTVNGTGRPRVRYKGV